jgi:predicted nucleic acid-binding protein
MKYLVDTDTLIDYMADRGNARNQIDAMIEAGDDVALCAVTIAEIYTGLTDKKRATWDNWLRALSYWQISFDVAVQAGIYRKTASESGRTLSVSDSLLAALARERGATLLTSNIKDYPMKEVRVMSLREKAA